MEMHGFHKENHLQTRGFSTSNEDLSVNNRDSNRLFCWGVVQHFHFMGDSTIHFVRMLMGCDRIGHFKQQGIFGFLSQ